MENLIYRLHCSGHQVLTLCGSCRFKDLYTEINIRLSLLNYLVFSVASFGLNDKGRPLSETEKVALDVTHKLKIDHSEAIVVINKDGYIGDSTRSEIEYAKAKGKPIFYLVPYN